MKNMLRFLLMIFFFGCMSSTQEKGDKSVNITPHTQQKKIPSDTLVKKGVLIKDSTLINNDTPTKLDSISKKEIIKENKNQDITPPKKHKKKKHKKKKHHRKKYRLSEGKPNIYFNNTEYHFGTIKVGKIIHHKFKFTNTGNAPLEILNATASCGCTYPSYPFLPIKKNASAYIDVSFNSEHKWGDVHPEIKIFTNIRKAPYTLNFKGYVDDSEVKKVSIQKDTLSKSKK